MGEPNEKGINQQKVHKCILAKGDIAKYTQEGMKICGFTCIFCVLLLLAVKRCPHVLTMNVYTDSIVFIVNPGCLTCCAGRHLALYRNASLVIDLP